MNRRVIQVLCRSRYLLLFLTVTLGCNSSPSDSSDTSTSLVSALVQTEGREELLRRIASAESDYSETQRLFQTAGGAFRLRSMQARIQEQLQAWQRLEKLPESTSDQQREAILAQIRLLTHGADAEWTGFDAQLTALRDRLSAERAGSPEAAHADAAVIWHAQLRKLADRDQTLTALEQHAANYPSSPTGPTLYARYILMLVESNQLPDATQVSEVAAQRYQDPELGRPIHEAMKQIQAIYVADEQRRSMLASRAQQFGGHHDGFFVLFLRPKKLAHMAEVDYVVAHGLADAIRLADSAEACEMKGWFPDSPTGEEQANSLAERLLGENTIEIMSYD